MPAIEILRAVALTSAALVGLSNSAQSQADHVRRCNHGEPRVAIESCTTLLRVIPDAPMPLLRRAAAFAALDQWDKAISDYSTYLVHKPRDAAILYERGQVHLHRSAYRRAIDDFTAALAVRPTWAAALNGRAWARFKLLDVDAAMVDVGAALLSEPNHVASLDTRGHIYEHRGERDKAIADYRRALQLDPSHPLAYITREGLRRLDAAP